MMPHVISALGWLPNPPARAIGRLFLHLPDTPDVIKLRCFFENLPPLASPNLKKNLKISKKSPTNLIVISYSLKQAKISYANGRVSVRIFYKNNLICFRF